MSLTNLSQVLLRNSDLLLAKYPLLFNMPADELINEMLSKNPTSQLNCFTNNFEQYQQYKNFNSERFNCIFSAEYQANIIHDLVIINFPKSKLELKFTLAMLSACTNKDSRILVVGENKSGIKSIDKLTKEYFSFCQKVDSARHCLLVEAQLLAPDTEFNLQDWFHHYQINVNNNQLKVAALPGVFSQAKLDIGTKVLLESLDKLTTTTDNSKVLDFGCGAGVIACFIGLKNSNAALHLTDVSALALTSAKQTLALNGLSGEVFATNSLSNIREQYQHIVSNPPFHQGIKTNYLATESFLQGIKPHLSIDGKLTVVANSFLQYKSIIEKSLNKTQLLNKKNGFTVYQAENSKRKK